MVLLAQHHYDSRWRGKTHRLGQYQTGSTAGFSRLPYLSLKN